MKLITEEYFLIKDNVFLSILGNRYARSNLKNSDNYTELGSTNQRVLHCRCR